MSEMDMEGSQQLPVVPGSREGDGDQQPNSPGSGFIQLDSDDSSSSSAKESDIDMSDDDETAADVLAQNHERQANSDAISRKRKLPEPSATDGPSSSPTDLQNRKKVKLNEDGVDHSPRQDVPDQRKGRDKSVLLPPEVWHRVFTFCPPRTLGNLLRVNKLFNVYLEPSSQVQKDFPSVPSKSTVDVLKPDAIWRASRSFFWSNMPAPLRSRTELAMWRLVCSSKCQYCGKRDSRDRHSPLTVPDAYHSGPGSDGVTVLWPFATRACGPCLLKHSVKETDILLSSTIPAAIIPALSFVFVTQDLQVLTVNTVQKGPVPDDIQLSKIFLSEDVEELKREFFMVKEMGPGVAEEWLKGLEGRGKTQRQQALKWEQAQTSGGISKMRTQLHPLPPKPTLTPAQVADATRPFEQRPWPGLPPRQERSMEAATAKKASRVAEIERRAARLSPPLLPDVLHHMRSFQAASQVAMPFDDNAWELLKPLLLAQRAEAEKLVKQAEEQVSGSVKQETPAGRQLEVTLATTKEARDAIDKKWEDVQAPLRTEIAGYADDMIASKWNNGKDVTRETCSRFAVEVLIEIRKRFYEKIAREDRAANQANGYPKTDPVDGPYTRKLTLENMKWVFDAKIKPITEHFRREIFFCSGCENNLKAFGFEGVVQHYAAKHTNALSAGNIVVHWRAEWPEQPPFSFEARVNNKPPARQDPIPLLPNGTPGFQPQPQLSHSAPYSAPPVPSYGPPGFEDNYYQPTPPSYGPPGPYPPPMANYGPPLGAQPAYPAPNYPLPQPNASYTPGGVNPPQAYGPPMPVTSSGPQYAQNFGTYQANNQASYAAPHFPSPALYPALYPSQLEDVARASRDVWNALNSVKDLPGNMKIFSVIHHAAKRFQARHNEHLTLAMFNDGLSNNKDMRPVRNVSSLNCKACHFGLGNTSMVQEDRTSFSFPQLVNHFLKKHVEPMQAQMPHMPPLDWITDMVLLPEQHLINQFFSSTSLDGYKQTLLRDAFPFAAQQQATAAQSNAQQYFGGAPSGHMVGAGLVPESVSNHAQYHVQPNPTGQPTPFEGLQNGQGYSIPPGSHTPQEYQYLHYPQAAVPAQETLAPPQVSLAPDHQPAVAAETSQDRRGQSDGRNSRGSKPSKNQKKNKNKGKSKNGGMSEADRRARDEELRKAQEVAQREEDEIKAMWAADKAREVHTSANVQKESSPQKSAPPPKIKTELLESRPASIQEQSPRIPPTHRLRPTLGTGRIAASDSAPADVADRTTASAHVSTPVRDEEPNILDALEMHLSDRPAQTRPWVSIISDPYRGRREVVKDDARYTTRTYDSLNHRSRSPPSYGNQQPTTRYSPRPQQSPPPVRLYPHEREPMYNARTKFAGSNEAHFDRVRAAEADPISPRASVVPAPPDPVYERHERHIIREDSQRAEVRPHRTDEMIYEEASRREYYPHPEEFRSKERARVHRTLYELVEVIDEHGPYLIRRPVRDVEAYPISYEPVHPRHASLAPYSGPIPTSRPKYIQDPTAPAACHEFSPEPYPRPGPTHHSSLREADQRRQEHMAPPPRVSQPTISRADPAYYEEYDPHFPAGTMAGSSGR